MGIYRYIFNVYLMDNSPIVNSTKNIRQRTILQIVCVYPPSLPFAAHTCTIIVGYHLAQVGMALSTLMFISQNTDDLHSVHMCARHNLHMGIIIYALLERNHRILAAGI